MTRSSRLIFAMGLFWLIQIWIPSLRAAQVCEEHLTFADGLLPTRELFVSPAGNDSTGDGSRQRPLRTLLRASRQAGPGTAIRLLPGAHVPGQFVNGLAGTAAAPIWIGGVPGMEKPLFSGGSEAIHLAGARYLVLENLEVAGSTANGINVDDAAAYANPDAARWLVFRNITFRNIGSGGNQDALKLSGVNDFWVLNCSFAGGSAGGSGIDHVGCHRGLIAHCSFENMGSNSIQCKGGSEDIEVHGCRFTNGGQRAVNIGGSTGFEFFRPPLRAGETNVEARRIRVVANLFQGSDAPVAFVGSVDCLAANNTIINPTRWVMRILQETVTTGDRIFAPSGRSRFINNLIYFRRSLISTFVNAGANTAPNSFQFANNLWFAHDNPSASTPSLPVAETGGITRQDPRFTRPDAGDFSLSPGSPAIGRGISLTEVRADIADRCCTTPPSIGAHEAGEATPRRSDADPIPDWWEERFNLDRLNPLDALLDSDGDGATNQDEFLAGTNPRNPASHFRIESHGVREGRFWVRFAALSRRTYRVEQRLDSSIPDQQWKTVQQLEGFGDWTEVVLDQPLPGNLVMIRVLALMH